MRTTLIVCFCFLTLVSAAHAVTFADITFDAASKRAAAENKWVLVDFHATWCTGCHVMDKVTWPDPDVTRLLDAHCVPMRVEAEKGAALAGRFKVDVFPTVLVLRPDGTEVGRIVGYHDAKAFLKEFNALLDGQDLVAYARAVAGDAVEVRVLVDDRPNPDGTGPTGAAPVDPPRDAKVVLSIESLAGADGNMHVVDGRTIRLKGRVTANPDGTRRVSVVFSQRGKEVREQVSTTLMLVPDQQRVIGTLSGSGGARLVAVTLKADDGTAEGAAE